MTNTSADHGYENSTSGYGDANFATLVYIIWRRKFLVIAMMILGLIIASGLISITRPTYISHAHILVNSEFDSFSPENFSITKKLSVFDTGPILTELQVLKSRKLASRVIKRLEDNGGPAASSAPVERATSTGFYGLSMGESVTDNLPLEATDPDFSMKVTRFLDSLRVVSIPGSLAVKISFLSSDPRNAALVVNTLIDEYIKMKLSEKLDLQQKVTRWLTNRLDSLRDNLSKAETEIEKHKAKYGLISEKQDVLSARRIAELETQYSKTKEEYSFLQSQLEQLSGKNTQNVLTALQSSAVNTSLMRQLEEKRIRNEQSILELSQRYGPKHPNMVNAKLKLDSTNNEITKEYAKAKSILRKQISVTKRQLKDIEKNLLVSPTTDEKGPTPNSDALVKLKELEREAEASRLVLRGFLETYEKSVGKSELEDSEVEIISHATPPIEPAYPNKILIYSLSIFASLIFALCLAILLEKISHFNAAGRKEEELA